MTGPAEALAQALRRQPTVKTFYNEGVAYAWVKEDPYDVNRRFLLVERRWEHLYRKRDSLGFDWYLWENEVKPRSLESIIIIYDAGPGQGRTIYAANLSTWYLSSFLVQHQGFAEQQQLPRNCMEVLERD